MCMAVAALACTGVSAAAVQEFERYEERTENTSEMNGILTIKEGGVIVGNISCQFDEFVTTK